jgi:hypothetical protein
MFCNTTSDARLGASGVRLAVKRWLDRAALAPGGARFRRLGKKSDHDGSFLD